MIAWMHVASMLGLKTMGEAIELLKSLHVKKLEPTHS